MEDVSVNSGNEKKGTVTYSARLNEDLKERLMEALAKNNGGTQDFFEKMLNHYNIAEGNVVEHKEMEDVARAWDVISNSMAKLVAGIELAEHERKQTQNRYTSEVTSIVEQNDLLLAKITELESTLKISKDEREIELVIANEEIERFKLIEVERDDMKVTIKDLNTKLIASEKEIKRLMGVEEMVGDVRADAKAAKEALKVAIGERDQAVETANKTNESIAKQLKDALKAVDQADIDKQQAVFQAEKKAFEQYRADLTELDRLRQLLNVKDQMATKEQNV